MASASPDVPQNSDPSADLIYKLDLQYARQDRCPVGDGLELYYEVHGSGDTTILFLNHMFLIAPVWRGLTDQLAKRYQLVFYDLRNQGASTRYPGPIRWSDHTDDLERLLDHIGIDKTYIIGTSISALAVRDFALDHPDRVKGLVQCGPAFSPYGDRRRIMMTDSWLASLRWGGLEGLWDQLYGLVFSDSTIQQGGEAMYLALREAFCAQHTPEQIEVNLAAAQSTSDDPDKLRRITAPTLLMLGDSDWMWGESNREEALRLMPHSSLQMIPRAGHLPYFEANQAFQQGIMEFVDKCEAELRHGVMSGSSPQ